MEAAASQHDLFIVQNDQASINIPYFALPLLKREITVLYNDFVGAE
jgi:hypothetical protein